MNRPLIFIGAFAVAAVVSGWVLVTHHDHAPESLHALAAPAPAPAPVAPELPPATVVEDTAPAPAPVVANASAEAVAVKKSKSVKVKTAKAPIQDPEAREALSLVGADPDAEAYWWGAINDPTLPATERQDLIEDLNEDGLSDPKHPAPEDMPLIANRIQLLEEMAPYAMDQVNAAAFQEAHKDLVNLLNGVPVK